MKNSTVRNLLLVCLFLDLALIGVVVYDYFQNDSDWIVIVLGVFAVFVIITAILFFLAGRTQPADPERVVVRVVEERPGETVLVPQPTGDIHPPIPPAPLRSTHFVSPVPPARSAALARHLPPGGPFVFNGYTLHKKEVRLANRNGSRTIYFFSKKKPKSGKPCPKPAGYHVGVNERTGLPFLKKGAGKDGEDLTPVAQASPARTRGAADERTPAGANGHDYRPQCQALTADNAQCRNSARKGSKYCAPHFGYQPPTTTQAAKHIEGKDWSDDDRQTDAGSVREADTKARVPKAKDTKPSVRKSWFGRKRAGQ